MLNHALVAASDAKTPHALATLHAAGANVYRTDEDGAIQLSSDGRTYTIEPFARPQTPR